MRRINIDTAVARVIADVRAERQFVVGANGNGNGLPPGLPKPCQPGTGVPQRSDCYRNGCRLCDLTKCANSTTVAATTAVQLQIEPANTRYFEPIAFEIVVHLTSDANTNRRARITAVSIGGSPQEAFDNRAPDANTTQYVLSDAYLPSGFGPVPVPWGYFSRITDSKPLVITLFNPNADNITINAICYGNAFDNIPDNAYGSFPPAGTPWGNGGWGRVLPSMCGGGSLS